MANIEPRGAKEGEWSSAICRGMLRTCKITAKRSSIGVVCAHSVALWTAEESNPWSFPFSPGVFLATLALFLPFGVSHLVSQVHLST